MKITLPLKDLFQWIGTIKCNEGDLWEFGFKWVLGGVASDEFGA
jgi:hypothetical protein